LPQKFSLHGVARSSQYIITLRRIRVLSGGKKAVWEPLVQSEAGDRAKLGELIRSIRIGLVTTVDRDGQLHTRPLQTMQVDSDETLWFFTDWKSLKVDELHHDARVSVGYADPASHVFVAVRGTGRLLRDPQKAKEIWSIEQRAYYPDGPADGRLALLQVRIDRAEYWIAPGRVSYLIAAAKATATGTPAGVIGENRKL
jgi:general stress protein 26